MTENIPVIVENEKEQIKGQLIEISAQSTDGSLQPVGVVLLEDGTFKSVPLEWITQVMYL